MHVYRTIDSNVNLQLDQKSRYINENGTAVEMQL